MTEPMCRAYEKIHEHTVEVAPPFLHMPTTKTLLVLASRLAAFSLCEFDVTLVYLKPGLLVALKYYKCMVLELSLILSFLITDSFHIPRTLKHLYV